jgi:DNA-binding transcriptional LysR family regulator
MHVPFKAINVFHTAAKLGSITRAAAELGVTPSAVSQQIQALEVQLGASLTAKVGRNIVLTEAGTRYFASITEEIEHITEATRSVRGLHATTTLSVRATPTLSNSWLLPRLGRFLAAFPDIDVRLDASTEPTDFSRDAVDLEIRHGDGRWPGMFVEGLAETRFIPVASPTLMSAESATPADFLGHRLIHSVKAQFGWTRWFGLFEMKPVRTRRLLFDRSHMAIDAAVRGLGIALESTLMMEAELSKGLLVCPVRAPPDVRLTTQWIICPTDHLRQRKVRVFLDWLRHEQSVWQASVTALGW